jgi:hypothetical protein
MPDPRRLRVGDRIVYVALPDEWRRPEIRVHAASRRFLRTIVARGRPVRIARVDDDGRPWFRARMRRKDGRLEHHEWCVVETTGWRRVAPRKPPRG